MNNYGGGACKHMILLLRLERIEDGAPYYMYVDPTFRQVTPSAKEDIRFFKPLPVPEEGDKMRPPVPAPYRDFGGPLFEHCYESFEDAFESLRDLVGDHTSEEAFAAFLEEHAGLQPDTSPGSAAGSAAVTAIPDNMLQRLAMTRTVQPRG